MSQAASSKRPASSLEQRQMSSARTRARCDKAEVRRGPESHVCAITRSKPFHSITAPALEIVDGERNNGASSALLSISAKREMSCGAATQ
jgi:hypothetical protein